MYVVFSQPRKVFNLICKNLSMEKEKLIDWVVNTNVQVHGLVVNACQTGDAEYLKYALMFDPLILQVLEPGEARLMGEGLIDAELQWLPQFQ